MSFAGRSPDRFDRTDTAKGRALRPFALLLLALLSSLLATLASAEPPHLPEIPYGGYNVDRDPSFARRLYPAVLKRYFDLKTRDVVLHSPTLDRMASSSGGNFASDASGAAARFTTNEEMSDFLARLPSTRMRRQSLATIASKNKNGGTEALFALPLLTFSKPSVESLTELRALGKPVVWFQAQIHGDEPAGAEAMMVLARDLAEDRENLLDSISVVVVPRVNVDGAWRNQRGTNSADPDFENLDLNRDALAVLSPITRALRGAFLACRPHVFVDFHEMGYAVDGSGEYANPGNSGSLIRHRYYNDYDLAILVAHPYNTPGKITELARELESGVARDALSAGLKAERYVYDADWIVGAESVVRQLRGASGTTFLVRPARMMEGPPDECISDSAAALSPAVSLLVETRAPKILTNFKTRVYAHYVAASSILRQVVARPDAFAEAVEGGARGISEMGRNPAAADDVVLWARQGEERGVSLSTLAPDASKRGVSTESFKLGRFYGNRLLTPVKSVRRPYAYILSADEANAPQLAARLALTGVALSRLPGRATLRVEVYTVRSVAPAEGPALGYATRSGDYFPMNRTLTHAIDGVSASPGERTFPKGTYFFRMSQPSANLAALAVEPMANRNLGNYWYTLSREYKASAALGFLPFRIGGEFPVYRCMEPIDLP